MIPWREILQKILERQNDQRQAAQVPASPGQRGEGGPSRWPSIGDTLQPPKDYANITQCCQDCNYISFSYFFPKNDGKFCDLIGLLYKLHYVSQTLNSGWLPSLNSSQTSFSSVYYFPANSQSCSLTLLPSGPTVLWACGKEKPQVLLPSGLHDFFLVFTLLLC